MESKKRILLIDDDSDFVQANRALLESEGYEVFAAHDGRSGMEAARARKPDLILLDVMMSTDTEGMEVSRALRGAPDLRAIPVVLMTGVRKAMRLPFAFEPDPENLPVLRVLEKPVPPPRLLEAVRQALA
jgi:CheY-like chemotaxis protein